jgi:hypothetical protein
MTSAIDCSDYGHSPQRKPTNSARQQRRFAATRPSAHAEKSSSPRSGQRVVETAGSPPTTRLNEQGLFRLARELHTRLGDDLVAQLINSRWADLRKHVRSVAKEPRFLAAPQSHAEPGVASETPASTI